MLIHFLCLCRLLQNLNLLKVAYLTDQVRQSYIPVALIVYFYELRGYVFFHISMAMAAYITDSQLACSLLTCVYQSSKNLHFRRDVNAYLCGVERSDKMTLTLGFRSGRNFRHFGLDKQATSNVPFKTFINSFDSFLHNLPREQNMRTRYITYVA